MAYEWGRFTWWLSQGQNATAATAVLTFVLVLVTAWYAWITNRILVYSTLQAREELRPNLIVKVIGNDSITPTGVDRTTGQIRIQNIGKYVVAILNVRLTRHVDDRISSSCTLDNLHGALLQASEDLIHPFDVSSLVRGNDVGFLAYTLVVVASDRSNRIMMTYDYRTHVNKTLTHPGAPVAVRIRTVFGPVLRSWWSFQGRMRRILRR
jgi:hypothetical protein